jgi:hypothetical protein
MYNRPRAVRITHALEALFIGVLVLLSPRAGECTTASRKPLTHHWKLEQGRFRYSTRQYRVRTNLENTQREYERAFGIPFEVALRSYRAQAQFLREIGAKFTDDAYGPPHDFTAQRVITAIQKRRREARLSVKIAPEDEIWPASIYHDRQGEVVLARIDRPTPPELGEATEDFISFPDQIRGMAEGRFVLGKGNDAEGNGYAIHDFGHISAMWDNPAYMTSLRRGAARFVSSSAWELLRESYRTDASAEATEFKAEFYSRFVLGTEWAASLPRAKRSRLIKSLGLSARLKGSALTVEAVKASLSPRLLGDWDTVALPLIRRIAAFHDKHVRRLGGSTNDLMNAPNVATQMYMRLPPDEIAARTLGPTIEVLRRFAERGLYEDWRRPHVADIAARAVTWMLATSEFGPEAWGELAFHDMREGAHPLETRLRETGLW